MVGRRASPSGPTSPRPAAFAGHAPAARAGRARLLRPAPIPRRARRRPRSRGRTASTASATTTTGSAAAGCSSGPSTQCWRRDARLPVLRVLGERELDARWDGARPRVLMAQRYSDADDRRAHRAPAAAFRDRRYVRVDGRPLLLVYASATFPTSRPSLAIWRARAPRRASAICTSWPCSATCRTTPRRWLRRRVEFPPHRPRRRERHRAHAGLDPALPRQRVPVRQPRRRLPAAPAPRVSRSTAASRRCGTTPRAGRTTAWSSTQATPELFGVWCAHALRQTRRRQAGDERLAFVNAWNEWAEGNHLEPDARHGRASSRRSHRAGPRVTPDPPRPSFDDVFARRPGGRRPRGALERALGPEAEGRRSRRRSRS